MSTAQGERRLRLAATRSQLGALPVNELFELPGRPHVVYQLRNYSNTTNAEEAAQAARNDSPFLFKAFETGQIGPKRLARMHGDKPRVATIHEYLDWTVTAQAAEGDDELDFGGFRVLVILPRYRSGWPPPEGDPPAADGPHKPRIMGAPKPPLPVLQSHGKPVTAATIRSGPGYLEIPFVATHENKRGRGYCRCLVEAIEEVARTLGLTKLMLCSTNDAGVQATWQHLGFEYASDEQMESWDILHTDLVYLQNTTQMHKDVPARRPVKSVVIKQDAFRARCYAFVGQKRPLRPGHGSASQANSGQRSARRRLSSRPSASVSRSESQSQSAAAMALVGAKEQEFAAASKAAAAGPGSWDGHVTGAAGNPGGAAGGLGGAAGEGDEAQRHQAAGAAREESVVGGGPPTPQPAGGLPPRPAHAHMAGLSAADPPSVSCTDAGRVDSTEADAYLQAQGLGPGCYSASHAGFAPGPPHGGAPQLQLLPPPGMAMVHGGGGGGHGAAGPWGQLHPGAGLGMGQGPSCGRLGPGPGPMWLQPPGELGLVGGVQGLGGEPVDGLFLGQPPRPGHLGGLPHQSYAQLQDWGPGLAPGGEGGLLLAPGGLPHGPPGLLGPHGAFPDGLPPG